jgi:hypothetical protein
MFDIPTSYFRLELSKFVVEFAVLSPCPHKSYDALLGKTILAKTTKRVPHDENLMAQRTPTSAGYSPTGFSPFKTPHSSWLDRKRKPTSDLKMWMKFGIWAIPKD